mgnify:FL=1
MIVFDPASIPGNLYGYNLTWSGRLETTGEYYHYVSWEGTGSVYFSMTTNDFLKNIYDDSLVVFNSTTQLYLASGAGTVYGVAITTPVPSNPVIYYGFNTGGSFSKLCVGILHSSEVSGFSPSNTFFNSGKSVCLQQPNGVELGCQYCAPCSEGCSACSGGLESECYGCQSGYFRQPDSQACATTCPDPYNPDPATKSCKLCHDYCAECFGTTVDECTSCNTGYYLQPSSTTCAESCPPGSSTDSSTNTCTSN